jgi:hypothetical protein
VPNLAAIGIYPHAQRQPKPKDQPLLSSAPATDGTIQPPALAELLGRMAQQVLDGGKPYGDDRSTNLAGFLKELYSVLNWLERDGLPYAGSADQLIRTAAHQLDAEDKVDRVIETIDPADCTLREPDKRRKQYDRLARPDKTPLRVVDGGKATTRQPQPAPAPQAQPQQAPFRILGWNTNLSAIWVQTGQTGIVASIPPTKNGLQRIAPLPYWEALYPGRTGPGWDAAIGSICQQAHDLGQTFTPDRIRGRGVWLDNNRVVWHLGNRLEVDGQLQPLTALRDSGWTYASLPALAINPEVLPLTDAEGTAILDLIQNRMQWGSAGDGLLIAGSIVLGNICGALDIRPGLQLTGPSRDGKSTRERTIIRPLQGGLGVRPSGATEAGIRQRMQSDALPVVIDESEGEAAKQREGHLKLLRLSFDGQEQIKGTAGGQALTYTMRSSITLIGINATVPNLADRNRLVVIRPRKMPSAQWTEFQLQRDALITVETGRRLIRRSVSNLKAVLANIKTFQAVVVGQGLADRSAEVYGSLLAGAHHLTSTAVLEPAQAITWLASVGWTGIDEETQEAIATDAEGLACLDHLLGHSVSWKCSQTGAVDVRELLAIVKGSPEPADAVKALGRLGVKLDRKHGLVVSNKTRIFCGTRWAKGAHRDRLLEITGSDRVSTAVWFTGGGSHKAVAIPVECLALTETEA